MHRRFFAFALLALSGCATFSPDGGVAGVRELAGSRINQDLTAVVSDEDRARVSVIVRERLSAPLTAEDAVAVAIVNNPMLQAAFADLGIAEADLVQAGRLRNPGFSFAKFRRGSEREIERKFVFDVIGLVTMPWRLKEERASFAAAQLRTAHEVIKVADEARRAWVEALAAEESARYAEQVKDAAEASAKLAGQMARAGTFSALSQSREQLFYAQATAQLARARHGARAGRERLARSMGLWGEQLDFRLPGRLPDLPSAPRELRDAEATAIANRLDVQAAKRETDALALALGLTKVTRFVNVLHLGYERDSSNEAPSRTGYEIGLELPLFDWGGARIARAEAMYRQSLNLTATVAVRARSEVRETYSAYRSSYDLAKQYREEIVPLRKRISEENLLRYNGMLISVFELLADSRDQVSAVMAAIDAARDFWTADANLEMALMTGSPTITSQLKNSTGSAATAPGPGH